MCLILQSKAKSSYAVWKEKYTFCWILVISRSVEHSEMFASSLFPLLCFQKGKIHNCVFDRVWGRQNVYHCVRENRPM